MRHFIQDSTGNVATVRANIVRFDGTDTTFDTEAVAVGMLVAAGFREYSTAGGYAAL